MKKYQICTVIYICVCICSLLLGLVCFFVPTIGVIDTEFGINAHASISIFDYAIGDHMAVVQLDQFDEFDDLLNFEVDVVSELFGERSFHKEFNIPLFTILIMILAGIVSLVTKIVGFSKLNNKEKYVTKFIELPALLSYANACVIGIWVILIITKISDDLNHGEIDFSNIYYLPALILLIIIFVFFITRIIIATMVATEIQKYDDDAQFSLFPQSPILPEASIMPESTSKRDSTEELRKYYDLFNDGILTEEEFTEKKKEILEKEKQK